MREEGIGRRVRRLLAAAGGAAVAVALFGATAAASTVTVQAASPSVGNCYPFGLGGESLDEGEWTPFAAFVYKNVPPFDLRPSTPISFDTSFVNDADIKLEIALAPTSTNGGDVPAGPFTRVVSNNQEAAAPRGNAVQGDFDLSYPAQERFQFAGGGLIIRTSNPAPTYLADTTCTGNLVGGNAADPSGFFVGRRIRDDDGVPPWDEVDSTSVPAFRVTNTTTSPAPCAGRLALITGTPGPDRLQGTPGPDVIAGLGGGDTIRGAGGADVVCAGKGHDLVRGGAGRDRLLGQGGPDRLFGQAGRDLLKGGPGRDLLRGGPGRDRLRGGPGKDVVDQ